LPTQPNLQPPITSVARALEYKQQLQALDSRVEYLMTLYLSPDLTPQTIAEAAKAGITGRAGRLLCALGDGQATMQYNMCGLCVRTCRGEVVPARGDDQQRERD
jgi:hypothetical protein